MLITTGSVANDWSRFRGPSGSGWIEGPPIARKWSSEENLKWQTALLGKGASSPVVADGRVYVTCYTGYGIDRQNPGTRRDLVRHLIALDRESGTEIWRRSVASAADEDPYQGFITQHGYASSTPVTDGENVNWIKLVTHHRTFRHREEEPVLWSAHASQNPTVPILLSEP